jgi:hypothetical protein
MYRWLAVPALVLAVAAAPAFAGGIKGHYVEARTCDIWTGPCFANAEMNLTGRQAVMAWKVDQGSLDGACLDGLSVAAVVVASDTLGMKQTGPAKALLIVDEKADSAQRKALVKLAHQQGGDLLRNVVAVRSAPIELVVRPCKGNACFRLKAGEAAVETRCLDSHHDKVCGNEFAFYPPLATAVHVRPAVAVTHGYTGRGFGETWTEADRRGAYVGSFEIQ